MSSAELINMGWIADRVSLYDEEGVEGWRWTSPSGREVGVIGDWNEPPPLPDFEDIVRG